MESIRQRAQKGLISYGLSMLMPWPSISELAKLAGYDYIRLDLEHAYMSETEVRSVLQTARLIGIPCQVRISDLARITPLLGQEPAGIMVPHISGRPEAEEAVRLCKFAPVGDRGMDGSTRRMRCEGVKRIDYIAYAENYQDLIVQIESKEGIDNIDEILSIDGIDMIATGRADLSQALGVAGDKNNLAVLEAEEYIIRKSIEHRKIPTIAVDGKERLNELYAMGVRCFQIGKDEGILFRGIKDNLVKFKTGEILADKQLII